MTCYIYQFYMIPGPPITYGGDITNYTMAISHQTDFKITPGDSIRAVNIQNNHGAIIMMRISL